MIKRYRKRPLEIEAVQIDSNDYDGMCDILSWAGASPVDSLDCVMRIPTLEGDMLASPGDYIIKGIRGEFYPCKANIFEATYEEIT